MKPIELGPANPDDLIAVQPSGLPPSPRLSDELRDRRIAAQLKCGRTVCDSTTLTHYNQGTDRLYCTKCARAINQYNPGLCLPYQR